MKIEPTLFWKFCSNFYTSLTTFPKNRVGSIFDEEKLGRLQGSLRAQTGFKRMFQPPKDHPFDTKLLLLAKRKAAARYWS